jgi:hypothetical protein
VIGYRDTMRAGPHHLVIDGVRVQFGEDSTLWNPTDAQVEVLTRHPLRQRRFERVEVPDRRPRRKAVAESDTETSEQTEREEQ